MLVGNDVEYSGIEAVEKVCGIRLLLTVIMSGSRWTARISRSGAVETK